MEQERWKIWYKQYDENGKEIGAGVHIKDYAYLGRAQRVAREKYGDRNRFKYVVAFRNPWVTYKEETKCPFCENTYDRHKRHNHGDLGWSFSLVKREEQWKDSIHIHGNICDECAEKIKAFVEKIKAEKEKKV